MAENCHYSDVCFVFFFHFFCVFFHDHNQLYSEKQPEQQGQQEKTESKSEQQEKDGSKPEQPEKEPELKAEQEEEPPKKKRMMGRYKVSYSYMY